MPSIPKQAIESLRKYQEQSGRRLGASPGRTEEEILELTLKRAAEREAQSIRKGEFICEGVFKYPARLEELRWQRTREIIQRVVPGRGEDPIYLEMIARQAASLEITLCRQHTDSPNPKALALCDRILIGTTVDLTPKAFETFAGEDHFVVLLSYGFISFLYQAAKSTVLSWRPMTPPPGGSVSFGLKPEDINRVIEKNPYALGLLYKTISTYLFKGSPRAIGYDPPPAMYHPPLSLLTNCVERFVIAHEYGHALFEQLRSIAALPPDPTSWQEEFGADSFALFITLESAGVLDSIPPNVALQGAFFALAGFEVLRKALDIVRSGEVQEDAGSETHPPTLQRIAVLKELYLKHAIGGGSEPMAIKGALAPSESLELLWNRIQQRFLKVHHAGKKLHPIWR